jgi:hypothetical protein
MIARLPALTPPEIAHVNCWVDALRAYGVVVVDGWATEEKLERLSSEHKRVFAADFANARELNHYRPGVGSRAIRVITGQIHNLLPATYSFLTDAMLENVIAAYLGPMSSINHAAYLTLDIAHTTPITALHYDRKRAVKAFLCISPANETSGAPAFVPRSHRHGRVIREGHLACGVPESELPITSGHDGWTPIPMASPAGSLVVFDTDCLHMGGKVMPGHTRRVLRGHSHPAVE